MQFIAVRLGKDSVSDIKKIDEMDKSTFSPYTFEFECSQVERSITEGAYVWIYLGSDNNNGQSTSWNQGVRALGTLDELDHTGGFNTVSKLYIKVISLFPESYNQFNFIDSCCGLYSNFSAYPMVGVKSSRNNSVQRADESTRANSSAFLTAISILYPNFKTDLSSQAKQLISLLNFAPSITISTTRTTSYTPIEGFNKIYFGAPGSGKSHTIKLLLKGVHEAYIERVIFHPEVDYSSFVGSYRPIMELEAGLEVIKYRFYPQVFINSYVSAWKDLNHTYYLIIEEINRGNCAEIFGDIFQLLDRNSDYKITPVSEIKDYLLKQLGSTNKGIEGGKMQLPPNLVLLGTMNTSDQSLFPMDSAFKRRWGWEYVPINYDRLNEDGSDNESYDYKVAIDTASRFSWIEFIEKVNRLIKTNPNLGMDKCIGNYFIKPQSSVIQIEEFINKVIFYLWNDVFKDEDVTPFPTGITYEDFFPIKTNGVKILKEMIQELHISV